jgi:uncharacterized repeat protein (TIGR03806 family)
MEVRMGCRRFPLLLAILLAACAEGGGEGGGEDPPPPPVPLPFGLTERVGVTGLTFPTTAPQPGQISIVEAFPNLNFSSPLFLTFAPGDNTRIFVVEQQGTIQVFSSNPATSTKKTFLNITSKVDAGGEMGLLGLAFDPSYGSNGYFYVYYSASKSGVDHESIIARYQVSASDPDAANANSETILLRFDQPYSNHNGGWIGFGPDGYLYVCSGDGGSGGDPEENAQDLTTVLGKVLRITKTGGIPSDNPFVSTAGARDEIWAYGLRNPWRAGFDRDTGELWLGDVGQGSREEIDLVVKGGNYGWDIFEGNLDHENGGGVDIDTTEAPIRDYGRGSGSTIVGGYVYRGSDVPSLVGVYLHADYGSGTVWGLVYDGTNVTSNTVLGDVNSPTSFGEDANGEVYICSFDGNIYRFEETGGGGGGPFPQTLSATGLFSSVATLTPAPGLIEFDVNSPLWSDGARKRRWIALPGAERIGFDDTLAWDFPLGTVLVKHFELDTTDGSVRLETRVLLLEDTGWHGYTYRWNAAQTEANLLAGAETAVYEVPDAAAPGGERTQTWNFPSRTDCLGCHTNAAGRILGVRTRQLNGDFVYPAATDNQLRSWNNIGLFTTDIGDHAQYDALRDPADTTAPIEARARAYLDANCAICHRPGGPPPTAIDLRYGIALGSMNIVDVTPTAGDLGLVNARIAASGSKERSVLWERLRRLDATRMPPLASSVPDPAGVALIGAWIDAGPQ